MVKENISQKNMIPAGCAAAAAAVTATTSCSDNNISNIGFFTNEEIEMKKKLSGKNVDGENNVNDTITTTTISPTTEITKSICELNLSKISDEPDEHVRMVVTTEEDIHLETKETESINNNYITISSTPETTNPSINSYIITGSSSPTTATTTTTTTEHVKREENPFSFKHFLKRDITTSSSSTTSSPPPQASLAYGTTEPPYSTALNVETNIGLNDNNNSFNSNIYSMNRTLGGDGSTPSPSVTMSISSSTATKPIGSTNLTGAKPKIPQNIGNMDSYNRHNNNNNNNNNNNSNINTNGCYDYIINNNNNNNNNNYNVMDYYALVSSESTKMKRSPKFSSFDSQASLAEFAADPDYHQQRQRRHKNTISNDNLSMNNLFIDTDIMHYCSPSSSTSSILQHGDSVGVGGGSGGKNSYDDGPTSSRCCSYSNTSIGQTNNNNNNCNNINNGQTINMANKPRSVSLLNCNSVSPNYNNNRTNPYETTSTLPDFVQDHIVMEQWYGGGSGNSSGPGICGSGGQHSNSSNCSLSIDCQLSNNNNNHSNILPYENDVDIVEDGTTASNRNDIGGVNVNKLGSIGNPSLIDNNLPFDLRENLSTIPLDLPLHYSSPNRTLDGFNSGGGGGGSGSVGAVGGSGGVGNSGHHRSADLPLDLTGDFINIPNDRNLQSSGIGEQLQTLPDFLSDGPIHSSGRLADVASNLPQLETIDDNPNSLTRLRTENDRLQFELFCSRQQVAEQTDQIRELNEAINMLTSNENTYSANLVMNIEKVEKNLDKSNKKAAAAQNQIMKLKQQVKQLTSKIEALEQENYYLKEEGAVGGASARVPYRSAQNQHISSELLAAAANAECNLRQLLNGVENLRLLAHSIQDDDKIVISDDDFSDCDDDFTGPAL